MSGKLSSTPLPPSFPPEEGEGSRGGGVILITGGTGVMGSVLVRRLHETGHKVRVLTLPDDPAVSRVEDIAEIRYGNVANVEDVRGVCEGVSVVYHLAAIIIAPDKKLYDSINVGGTRNLTEEAKRAGVDHFIHVSSASVVYPKPTPYSLSKRACETIVKSRGVAFTIVRPTLVYDRKGGQEFDIFLEYLKKWPIVPFIGKGGSLKRPVFVDDIVDGLVALCGNKTARGKVYNFSGGEAISIMDFSKLCLRLLGTPKPFVCVPVWMCVAIAWVLELFFKNPPLRWPVIAGITQDANLDPTDAIKELGYRPKNVSEKLPECFPRES